MTSLQKETPAQLNHLCVDSPQPERLARFYCEMMDCAETPLNELRLLSGPRRSILIRPGATADLAYAAYRISTDSQLQTLRCRLAANDIACEPLHDPLLEPGSFVVADPQGRQTAFGVACHTLPHSGAPARLQHCVFQTTELDDVVRFYVDKLGFTVSDEVVSDDSRAAAVFLRSDDDHHTLAFFRGSRNEWDHHCYETNEWNDIRDWGDRFAAAEIPIFFGPGRHGPGNNLFFMVTDPDGNRLEFSAELQQVSIDSTAGVWPASERTLNSWGRAWMRS
ncbi:MULTISPECIES: VOC family protein [Burkholderia]|uniref:VOC family protein n=1 Tax=Burkholderia TaxID=32008 RepID=UPI001453546E|nr:MULTISPECIES: VOC family protein [Burkholderia]MBN3744359.1 glyoxalase [Burkholderia sp. Se-20373]MBN3768407.1 glyoxalase [Burkholderia sp. Se-20378]MBN3793641.1 glyoxalase [Burkholderia sp. Ac-20392]VWB70191.1 glyoxalase [Burkholderia lata]